MSDQSLPCCLAWLGFAPRESHFIATTKIYCVNSFSTLERISRASSFSLASLENDTALEAHQSSPRHQQRPSLSHKQSYEVSHHYHHQNHMRQLSQSSVASNFSVASSVASPRSKHRKETTVGTYTNTTVQSSGFAVPSPVGKSRKQIQHNKALPQPAVSVAVCKNSSEEQRRSSLFCNFTQKGIIWV